MSRLIRMLDILDAFTLEAPTRSTDELIKFTGSSRSTAYRYIRALQKGGLLSPVANGSWTLGSRILELDLQLRSCDPLYLSAGPVMKRLVERTGHTAPFVTHIDGRAFERQPRKMDGTFGARRLRCAPHARIHRQPSLESANRIRREE